MTNKFIALFQIRIKVAPMSEAIVNCCPCPTNEVVDIPGAPGQNGAAGTNGSNAYTLTTSTILLPASGADVSLPTGVADSSWMAINQVVFGGDGTFSATFRVVSKASPTTVQLKYLGYPSDSATGNTIAIGAVMTASAELPLFGAIPASITDNSGGAATSAIAAGVGIYTLAFFVNLVDIATTATTVMNNYVIGHAFKIINVAFVVEKAGTGAGAAATINTAINSSIVTGGTVALTLANTTPAGAILPAVQAPTTAANTGNAAAALGITTTSVTAFTAGSGWIVLRIQNTDQRDAMATVSAKINSLIAAL